MLRPGLAATDVSDYAEVFVSVDIAAADEAGACG